MISVTKLRNGTTFLHNSDPFKVIKYQHTHLSRGAGTIKLKVKNLRTGNISDKKFTSGEKLNEVEVMRRKLQFLYRDGDEYHFMDSNNFSQLSVDTKVVRENSTYLKDGEDYMVVFWINPKGGDEEPLEIDFPAKMDFRVSEAAPGVKGDTAASNYKDAKLESGQKVRVPLFVNKGDMIRVDTRTGNYVERVS